MRAYESVPLEDVKVELYITADTLQGLMALTSWLQGFQAGGKGGWAPGHFELLMLLRQIRSVNVENKK